MQDDFDDRIGMPEDDLGGGSDLAEAGGGAEEVEAIEVIDVEPAGRVSGGARSRSSSGRKRPAAARKSAPVKAKPKAKPRKASRKAPAKKQAAKRSKGTPKKSAGRKGARKGARKQGARKRRR
jgi:hypothetical protein